MAGSFDRDLINAPNRQSSGAPFEGQLTRATNDKIRLMKESELARANFDFEHRIRSERCGKFAGAVLSHYLQPFRARYLG